ncbi:MAG: RNA 2',3'-cyclic phosphodiesterase [Dehalococcoidia bacterium]|nr:MAG: RNA 2',3'-cyclic phosphodiesterase [Dehalococcoidia bacterium]
MTIEASGIRAFIAIELPDAVKKELGELQKKLSVAPERGIKWVAPDGIHLTLKFLGGVTPDCIEPVKQALTRATEGIKPFELEIRNLGAFPNLRRLVMVWCGLTGDLEHLNQLRKKVEEHISPMGFPPEKSPFSPHLILERLKENISPMARQSLSEKLAATNYHPGLRIPVTSISLMQSHLLSSGAVYKRLAVFPLKKW